MATQSFSYRFGRNLERRFSKRPYKVASILNYSIAPVSLWAISYNYFLYKPSPKDENSEYIHIVDLKEPEKVYLVHDFVGGKP